MEQHNETILDCQPNYDLSNIYTVVKRIVFAQMLTEAGYDTEETQFIYNESTKGFPLGYAGPNNRQQKSPNMPRRYGSKIQLWNKMVKEVNLKRFAGPFPSIPFSNYVQSPVNLVPKKSEDNSKQTCLVFNLSWPKLMSSNDYTPKELCSVKYKDLDHAVQL